MHTYTTFQNFRVSSVIFFINKIYIFTAAIHNIFIKLIKIDF